MLRMKLKHRVLASTFLNAVKTFPAVDETILKNYAVEV
jgi:hypothetical protein